MLSEQFVLSNLLNPIKYAVSSGAVRWWVDSGLLNFYLFQLNFILSAIRCYSDVGDEAGFTNACNELYNL